MESRTHRAGLANRLEPAAARPRVVAVEQGYQLWAPNYDRELNPLLALEERALLPLIPTLDGKMVLDLACGTGRWLALLLAKGARAGVGIDLSPAMLLEAFAKPPLKSKLIRGDCLALPLRSEAIDFGICSFALGHMVNLTEFAEEAARVIKPGGDLYLTDVHPEGYSRGWRTGFRHKNGVRHIVTFARPLESILDAFIPRGFELVRTVQHRFGAAEKRIFDETGKGRLFETACESRAVLACLFRRKARPTKIRG